MNENSNREISILINRVRDLVSNIKRIVDSQHDGADSISINDFIKLSDEVSDCEMVVGRLIDYVTLEILTRENARVDKRKRSVD